MRIGLVHYHLQPGGVASIIEHAVTALTDSEVSLVLLTGKEPRPEFPAPVKVILALQYEADRSTISCAELVPSMNMALLLRDVISLIFRRLF